METENLEKILPRKQALPHCLQGPQEFGGHHSWKMLRFSAS